MSSSSSPAPLSPTAPRRTCPATPARYEAGGVWHTALTDLTGSPVESVGNAGAVSGLTHYGPYGAARPGSADPLGIGYVGEYRDATGLVNLRARSYDPVLARFIGRDTTGGVASAPQTANRYSYATDNPLRYTDPSGHFIAAIAADPGAAFGLAIGFTGLPGAVYYGVSAIVGRDLATGRTLEPWERSIGVVALAVIPGARLAEQAISLGGRMVASLGRVARTVAAAARESSAFGALTRRLASLGGRAAGLGERLGGLEGVGARAEGLRARVEAGLGRLGEAARGGVGDLGDAAAAFGRTMREGRPMFVRLVLLRVGRARRSREGRRGGRGGPLPAAPPGAAATGQDPGRAQRPPGSRRPARPRSPRGEPAGNVSVGGGASSDDHGGAT